MAKFRLIKRTPWTSSTGQTGETLVVACGGEAVSLNVSDFEDIKVTAPVAAIPASGTGATAVAAQPAKPAYVVIDEPCELVKQTYQANDLSTKVGFRIKPKFGLEINTDRS